MQDKNFSKAMNNIFANLPDSKKLSNIHVEKKEKYFRDNSLSEKEHNELIKLLDKNNG